MFPDIYKSKFKFLIALVFFAGFSAAFAQLTDIANKPIAGAATADVKPNIMLLMDTSQSMSFSHMPDEVEGLQVDLPIGYKSYQCNALYYNPNTVYILPKDSLGVNLATPIFTSARHNYYSTTDTATVDLSTAFRAYDTTTRQNQSSTANDTAQPAYYYIYTGTATPLSYKTDPCTQTDTGVSGFAGNIAATGGNWTRKIVSATSGINSTDERVNFAIWYTYYRTRMAMTKSSLSRAFVGVTDSFRVGFISANPGKPVAAAKYQALSDFDSTNKAAWYTKVFAQEPSGSSPMREGLARVGRHYGGMMDGINSGMTPDPVSYSCQKNFTLMTTDGYWNTVAETAGPVKLDGSTLVGKQDNILTLNANWTPRPIWDGGSTSIRTTTDKDNTYSSLACVGAYEYRTTAQITRINTQTMQATTQPLQATAQNLQKTQQTYVSTSQTFADTSRTDQSTARTDMSTSQWTRNTSQLTKVTNQYQQWTTTLTKTQTTVSRSTTQTVASYSQTQKAVAQTTQTQTQQNQSTSQTTQTVVQALQSTSQVTQSTSRTTASTTQNLVSTTRQDQTVSKVYKSTSQLNSYNGLTELQTPVATCTAGGSISCITVTTPSTLVASCVAAAADSTNAYTTTTCSTTIVSGPTPVATCTPVAATSANGYQSTTCTTVATGPTPAATCSAISPTSGNSYTTTSCTTNNTGATPVASCTAASASSGNNYTTTTCTPINTGPTVVSTCSSISPVAGNNYTTTSCGTSTTGPTPVASCTPSGPTNGLTTTCSSGGSVTFVQTCTAQTGSSANSWITISCNTATTGPTPVASCTAQTAASGNSWKTITCPVVTISATAPVQTCTAVTASSGNNYTATVCANGPNYAAAAFVQTCTPVTATAANSWTATTCTPVTSGPTPIASCTNTAATSANSWQATTCGTNTTGPTLVATCSTASAKSSNSYTQTGCTTATTSGPTAVTSCTNSAASAANNYVTTTCTNPKSTTTYLQSCTVGSTTSGAVTTVCNLATTGPTGVATCTPITGTSANNWLTTTCPTATTGPTLVASCTNATASSSNSYVATTCTNAPTGPTPVQACTAATATSANNYTATTCAPVTTGPTAVAACTPVTPTAGNSWTTTTCTPVLGSTAVSSATCAGIAPTSANSYTTTTCRTVNTGPTLASSCTAQTAASGNSWLGRTCSTTVLTGPSPVASCTTVAPTSANNYTETVCSTNNTAATPVASCTNQSPLAANNYVTITCTSAATGPTAVASCSAGTTGSPTFVTTTCTPAVTNTLVASCTPASPISGNSYTTTACTTDSTGPTQVSAASCTDAAATSSNNYVATTCTPLPAHKIQYQTATSQLVEYISNTTLVKTDPLTTSTTAITDLDGVCYTDGVDTLPAQPAKPALPTGCTAWPCVVTVDTAVGGSANSLADVAQYYYITDLRPDMSNDVKATGTGLEDDTATHQHMTTFGLGLGVAGTIDYQSNYKTALTGAFANIRTGTQNWPAWPDLSVDYTNALNYNNTKSIDDFWHAAVNGRGEYFSAGDPQAVVTGLSSALDKIKTAAGSGGAATPANNTPVAGDNASFLTSFITQDWTGDLQSRAIDLSTGEVTTTVSWSARDKLDAMAGAACDNRVIYIRKTTATNNLGKFTWNTQACDSNGSPTGTSDTGLSATEQAYFGSAAVANFTQYAAMSDGTSGTANQRSLAAGANLVNFIRGQRGLEGFTENSATKLYRARSHILGDIVGSVAKFVKAPSSTYSDTGYAAFKTSQASRTPMIYVGSNGGMLHAFYAPISASDPQAANAGKEAWAYIPQPVLPDLYRLADNDYKSNHHFYVDGSPTSGDVYDTTAGAWKTILVGGLNAGGKGYYALDITDPTTPKSLWEFNFSSTCGGTGTDCNLGLTFGRPVISKLANGTWVVFVTSGYNNVGSSTGSGDGVGYLYVLNAVTGSVISKISTGVGTSTNPSGLREVNNYVANGAVDNKTLRVYGGDLLGNVWRFDVNGTIAPTGTEATLVGITKDSSGTTQPITTRMQLAEVDGKTMILVGTGKFLGSSDTATTQTQSIYGFKDTPGAVVVYSNLRGSLKPLTLTQSGTIRTSSCTGSTATCALSAGWVIDLPESKERVNVDPFVVSGTVVFSSNVPSNSACQAGGHSWLNYVSLTSGGVVSTSVNQEASSQLNDSLSVGLSYVILPDGRVVATSVGSDSSTSIREIPIAPPDPLGRRVSWREIKR